MSLATEKQVFEDNLPEWDEYAGKFVLIKDTDIVGFFDTYTDAIAQGYREFDLDPFFVAMVNRYESAQLVTRLIV